MSVTPFSTAVRIVAIPWSSSLVGRTDIGMPPRPIALTVRSPIRRCCMGPWYPMRPVPWLAGWQLPAAAAELRHDRAVARGDGDVADPGPPLARCAPPRSRSARRRRARPAGTSRRSPAATVTTPWELQATAKALSARLATRPPCAVPWPLTMSSRTVIRTTARPSPQSTSSIPSARLASSAAHMSRMSTAPAHASKSTVTGSASG